MQKIKKKSSLKKVCWFFCKKSAFFSLHYTIIKIQFDPFDDPFVDDVFQGSGFFVNRKSACFQFNPAFHIIRLLSRLLVLVRGQLIFHLWAVVLNITSSSRIKRTYFRGWEMILQMRTIRSLYVAIFVNLTFINQSTHQSINQSTNPPINHTIDHLIYQ